MEIKILPLHFLDQRTRRKHERQYETAKGPNKWSEMFN